MSADTTACPNDNVYNPLVLALLGYEACEPTYVNPAGVKWWCIDKGHRLYHVELVDGTRKWVAVNDSGWLMFETDDLNALYLWDELRKHARD